MTVRTSPKNGTRRRARRVPFNPFKRKKVPPKEESSSSDEKEEEPRTGGRAALGKMTRLDHLSRSGTVAAQARGGGRGGGDADVSEGAGGCFPHPPARVAHDAIVEGSWILRGRRERELERHQTTPTTRTSRHEARRPESGSWLRDRAAARRTPRALSPGWRLHPIAPKDGKVLPEPRRVRVKPNRGIKRRMKTNFSTPRILIGGRSGGAPTLQIPVEAPVDVGRTLAYLREGDSSDLCGSRASEASKEEGPQGVQRC